MDQHPPDTHETIRQAAEAAGYVDNAGVAGEPLTPEGHQFADFVAQAQAPEAPSTALGAHLEPGDWVVYYPAPGDDWCRQNGATRLAACVTRVHGSGPKPTANLFVILDGRGTALRPSVHHASALTEKARVELGGYWAHKGE